MSKTVKEDAILLNAMHAAQARFGYLTDEAVAELAAAFGLTRAEVVSIATFYSMLQMTAPPPVCIQICKSAPCHVAGAREVIAALEGELGITMGETTADGRYRLEYVECQGQCQDAPTILLNGRLCSGVTPGRVSALLREGVE